MNKPKTARWLVSALLVSLLTGCAATPETHFYTLSPLPPSAQAEGKHTSPRLLGIGPLSVPALLERKQIVTRDGSNRITTSEFHQWAAPLQNAITETLAQNLSALLPGDIVKAYPWSAYGEMDYRIQIEITRFETDTGRTAVLAANWSIMDDRGHRPVKHGRAHIVRAFAGNGYADIVGALNETLTEFSRQLAGVLAATNLKGGNDRSIRLHP